MKEKGIKDEIAIRIDMTKRKSTTDIINDIEIVQDQDQDHGHGPDQMTDMIDMTEMFIKDIRNQDHIDIELFQNI